MDAAIQTGKADGWTNKMLKRFLFVAFQPLAQRPLTSSPQNQRVGLVLQDILWINLRSSKYVGNRFNPFYSCHHNRQSNTGPAETSGNEVFHCRVEDFGWKLGGFSRWQSFQSFFVGSIELGFCECDTSYVR